MNKRVLLITGEASAGKSTCCDYLASRYGFEVVLVSNIIRSFAGSNGLSLNVRADYLDAYRKMKNKMGEDIVTKTVLEVPEERLCIDGIRVVNDIKRISSTPGVVYSLVALHAPESIRFQRAMLKKSGIDRLTIEEFREDDAQDAYNPDLEMQNTRAVMAMADYHIDSSRQQELVFQDLDVVAQSLLAA